MRYLNKIVFINSASVRYAEIELDGNVHLIGTQGVGKSTLLRAILFFYNANKSKLGIPREKKGFDDYYFQYQNSYIIYEVEKEGIPFCVLAYKVNGKVAFRFFNSGYKSELFIDENNRAFESWDKIRNALGKEIHYSTIVSSYEDFRKIIYGDNKGLKPDFRKYALIESKQYQNIPRTIQNVLLNSNLEAKFIKDTIINSLSEDETTIDIENYSKVHLIDFEREINDIRIWFKTNKKGEIVIRNQAERVIDKYRIHNFLIREKKQLAHALGFRMDFIEKEKPLLISNSSKENNVLTALFNKRANLKDLHLKREQKLVSDIDYVKKELIKAAKKQTEYDNQSIDEVIKKVIQRDALERELKTLGEEKNLLKSAFGQISQRYEALILQVQNQQQELANHRSAEVNNIKSETGESREKLFQTYEKLIVQVKNDNQTEKETAFNELNGVVERENTLKRKKSELKYQVFYVAEINKCKKESNAIEEKVSGAHSIILNSKNEVNILRKEWELEENETVRSTVLKADVINSKKQKFTDQIQTISHKIAQSKSSLYGWLNDHVPNWEKTIGKVIDEDNVLFNSELNPKLIHNNSATFFGIELNLNGLENRTKTVAQYNDEITEFKIKISNLRNSLLQLNEDKEDSSQKLKTKFRKKLKVFKDVIAENEYFIAQSDHKLKKCQVELSEWVEKSKSEKINISNEIENKLNEVTSDKVKAQEKLEKIKIGIKRKITLKENKRDGEISSFKTLNQTRIDEIQLNISNNKEESEKRVKELRKEETSELDNKGADTQRISRIENRLLEVEKALEYIRNNEAIVIEYKKDKRELFDRIPEFRAEKTTLEKRQSLILEEHKDEIVKLDKKYFDQKTVVDGIQSKVDEFNTDEKAFSEFKKSDAFINIQIYFSDPILEDKDLKTAHSIISELNGRYYKGIENFKELQQNINAFNGNFTYKNIFSFKNDLNNDEDFLSFASDLKEFMEEDKINEFEKRVNTRFANIIHLIGRETTELNSKRGDIERIIKKINDDFSSKNFVEAIKEMEIRTLASSNPVVRLLIKIQEFNDENSLLLGETNLFTSTDSNSKNQKAVELLKELVKAIEKHKNPTLTLSESFDLQFKIVENDNNSGWVEKLSNVGSEGTDVLVKAMINILLLNVFKDSASKKFKDFKLHCMMDEIGRLHPNNVKGILRFANERNILLINGSPTSQNAIDYKYTYKLAKVQSESDAKKYITKINRLVKVNTKVLN